MAEPLPDISSHIWQTRYRCPELGEAEIGDTWRRVARGLAAVEGRDQVEWGANFLLILQDFRFLPGGRILAGTATPRTVTLFNCFVMGVVHDSIPGIFRALEEGARTMQQGGGIGYDFSTIRPRGARAGATGTIASGPVSFMRVWDAMCATIMSTGARRGAMMATLRCDHPDIEEFVAAKQQPGQLRRFNLSVQVTDAFMAATRTNDEWPLVFPAEALSTPGELVWRQWPGAPQPVACRVLKRMRAGELWERILRATYDHAEPGVLFVDRINQLNNLWYEEFISATNPCGEIPLPAYGACDLGSINLTRFVAEPFTANARIEMTALSETVRCAVRLLDDVIDVSHFPLPQQAERERRSRRIGLGITGLADALVMLGLDYGSEPAREAARSALRTICHSAYRASIDLAAAKGSFPGFDRDKYLQGAFIRQLPADIRDGIARRGIRNSHLIAIAPTGTSSLLAGNVSSGIEPIFAGEYSRKVLRDDGTPQEFVLTDYALRTWRAAKGQDSGYPDHFVTVGELSIHDHLEMQAALQPFVDNSISKTINVPTDYPLAEFRRVYDAAYDLGLKGCTTFRPNPVTGAILSEADAGVDAPHCCVLEREPD